jgi:hypothetical protein
VPVPMVLTRSTSSRGTRRSAADISWLGRREPGAGSSLISWAPDVPAAASNGTAPGLCTRAAGGAVCAGQHAPSPSSNQFDPRCDRRWLLRPDEEDLASKDGIGHNNNTLMLPPPAQINTCAVHAREALLS